MSKIYIRRKNNKWAKYIVVAVIIALLIMGLIVYKYYGYVFNKNVNYKYPLKINKEMTYDDIFQTLKEDSVLKNYTAFDWISQKKKYTNNIKWGNYVLNKDMNTNQIVNKLIAGNQDPVLLTFNNVRFKEEFASRISNQIALDSLSILNLFYNEELINRYGFNEYNFKSMFIPNTYEFWWTTSANEFIDKMYSEYEKFWNDERKRKAGAINLTPSEVSTLASIVQAETSKKDELKMVAGLYINRLKKGMYLQADPTVKFAVGDFTLKRILNHHLTTQSPYNTYLHTGLPPGPINFPETTAIDAVLNFDKHNYIYMAAKEDFSGYHNFARTLTQHNRNARRYHKALNKRKIFK